MATTNRHGRFTIRRAADNDAEAVTQLALSFHREDGHPLSQKGIDALLEMLKPDFRDGRVLLMIVDDQISGYGVLCHGYSIEFGGRDAFLDDIYIVPAHRSRGLGSALVESLEQCAREAGCRAIHLEIMPRNRAENLYRRLNYHDRGSKLLSKPL